MEGNIKQLQLAQLEAKKAQLLDQSLFLQNLYQLAKAELDNNKDDIAICSLMIDQLKNHDSLFVYEDEKAIRKEA
jgi:hypothetical protein